MHHFIPSGAILAGWIASCAPRPALVRLAPAPPQAIASAVTVPSVRAAAPVPSVALPASTRDPLNWVVEPVLQVPVTAIALGDGTRVAALANPPYVGDARGLRPVAVPAALQPKAGEVDRAGIYFGRDNEPRIMGQRQTQSGETAIYWRHLPNGWRDGREEIGRLGGAARGGLWGVLGGADPELVCRTGVVCIIKRQSGWTTVPAGESRRIVTLQDGVLWGLDASGISGIDRHGWALAIPAPAWSEPQALWATQGEAWVSAQTQLFHYADGKWQAAASPVGEVSSFWGARRDSIWIAGSAGAAHFDGRSWRTLSLSGPLHVVRGRDDSEVWFGGDAGLFRVGAPN
ncbi:MAG: hypothetical protein ABIQ16_11875 [Polyangiaceae bacterium]